MTSPVDVCAPFRGFAEVRRAKARLILPCAPYGQTGCVVTDNIFHMWLEMWLLEVMVAVGADTTIDVNGFYLSLDTTDWLESPAEGQEFHCLNPDQYLFTYDAVSPANVHVTAVEKLDANAGDNIYKGQQALFYEPDSLRRPSGTASLYARNCSNTLPEARPTLDVAAIDVASGFGTTILQKITNGETGDLVELRAALQRADGVELACEGGGKAVIAPKTWRLTLRNLASGPGAPPWCGLFEGYSVDVDYYGFVDGLSLFGHHWRSTDDDGCASRLECIVHPPDPPDFPDGYTIWTCMVVAWVTEMQMCVCILEGQTAKYAEHPDCVTGGTIPAIACSCETGDAYIEVTVPED